jgi:hypothetical protein
MRHPGRPSSLTLEQADATTPRILKCVDIDAAFDVELGECPREELCSP